MAAMAFNALADITADWKLHMPSDAWAVQVVETPGRVYFMQRTFEYNRNLPDRAIPSHSLFYYDKEGDEIISINDRTTANGNAVACIGYNADRKYLLVVYTDCNIDFIYDDGRVFNLQALRATTIPGKKLANSIAFDNDNNLAYVATTFGYVALNDLKHEVAESRNYGQDIQSIARCGSNIVLCSGDKIFYAPAADKRFSFSDYTQLQGAPAIGMIIPLNSDNFIGYSTLSSGSYLDIFRRDGNSYTWEEYYTDPKMFGYQQVGDGAYRLTGNVRMTLIRPDGTYSAFNRPNADWKFPAASLDGKTVWCLQDRLGLRSYLRDGSNFTLTHDFMRPNAPATYVSSDIAYSPTYGIIAGSNGMDRAYSSFGQSTPNNLSALKGGFWKEYGMPYTAPDKFKNTLNYFGVAIDPKNPNHVYRANTLGGLMRIDLSNPANNLIMANPSNANASYDGFIKIAEDQTEWLQLCRFSTPQFTPDGTMWSLFHNENLDRNELWYWTAADRAASTSASNYRPMKIVPVPTKFPPGNTDVMITLSRHPNMVIMGGHENGGTIMLLDHNGTPDYTGDDRYVFQDAPFDQDGGSVTFLTINNFYEDPETGLVWIMAERGLFTLNPATAFENPNSINRIKVARNDGTNLADYLLNEVNVNHLSVDGEGRKWFSTSNGLVCTSKDGRQILGEFTTDNSYLPSNSIIATCYNPDNNSILVATSEGLVEMFPSGSGMGAAAEEGIRAYPNPVEPDYYGWVRIDNVADGSLVKITDSRGGLVKELGPVQGGSVEWDVSGLNNTRVSTGVYYIMVSPGAGGGNTQISKILVLN